MSVCVFIAADCPLPEVRPSQNYSHQFNLDTHTFYDSGANDDYYLLPFCDAGSYCQKKYGVELELHQYTEERANRIIDYIKNALSQTDKLFPLKLVSTVGFLPTHTCYSASVPKELRSTIYNT